MSSSEPRHIIIICCDVEPMINMSDIECMNTNDSFHKMLQSCIGGPSRWCRAGLNKCIFSSGEKNYYVHAYFPKRRELSSIIIIIIINLCNSATRSRVILNTILIRSRTQVDIDTCAHAGLL